MAKAMAFATASVRLSQNAARAVIAAFEPSHSAQTMPKSTIAAISRRDYPWQAMNSLSYEIRANPDDQTHEVRLIVDGEDWIGSDRLGLDPPELRQQLVPEARDTLIVARCECGVVGCDDLIVDQRRTASSVEWLCPDREPLIFDRGDFDKLVDVLRHDHTWEPMGRTAERALDDLFHARETEDGYIFDWSSTRISPNIVTISVTRGDDQKLLEFSWDGATVESALKRGRQFLRERFDV